jgi:type II secretory pathway component PulM
VVKSKRLAKAHRMSVNTFFKRVKMTAVDIKKRIEKMPRNKLILISGGIVLTGVTGYLVVRTYIKKIDGKLFYLKAWSKDESKAQMAAESMRNKGLEARVIPMKLFRTTIHRVYARRP